MVSKSIKKNESIGNFARGRIFYGGWEFDREWFRSFDPFALHKQHSVNIERL